MAQYQDKTAVTTWGSARAKKFITQDGLEPKPWPEMGVRAYIAAQTAVALTVWAWTRAKFELEQIVAQNRAGTEVDA